MAFRMNLHPVVRSRSRSFVLPWLFAIALPAWAEPGSSGPQDLDGLVELALIRDPQAEAAALDAAAAEARAIAAGQPMSPQLMLGAESLGAAMDDPDPPM